MFVVTSISLTRAGGREDARTGKRFGGRGSRLKRELVKVVSHGSSAPSILLRRAVLTSRKTAQQMRRIA